MHICILILLIVVKVNELLQVMIVRSNLVF